jgi:transposase
MTNSILTVSVAGGQRPTVEGQNPRFSKGKIYGIDLGLKHFAVVTDSESPSCGTPL